MIGSLCVYTVYKITLNVWDKPSALVAASIYAFTPYIAGLSAVALREMVIIYPTLLSFHFFIKWYTTNTLKYFSYAMCLILIGIIFHAGVIVAFITYIYFFIKRNFKITSISGIRHIVLGVIFMIGLFMVAFQLRIGSSKLYFFYRAYDGTNEKSETFEAMVGKTANNGGNQYRETFIPISPKVVLYQLPNILISFYFYPYIWLQYQSNFQSPNGILSLLFFLFFFIYRRELRKNNKARLALMVSLLLIVFYAFGTSEYSAAVRHRAKSIPFMLIAFAPFFVKFYHFIFSKRSLRSKSLNS